MLLILIMGCQKAFYASLVLRATTMTNDNRTMKEVSHTPPNGESVTNVWERGDESPDELRDD